MTTVTPPFGVMITLSGLFGFLPRSRRGLPVMILMTAMMIAVIAAAVRYA